MEFEYSKYWAEKSKEERKYVYRPTVPITFSYKGRRFPQEAVLVDTGSDDIVLTFEVAEAIGLEPDLGNPEESHSAGGGKFNKYKSKDKVELIIEYEGFRPLKWKTYVYFVEKQMMSLVGHRGFLDRFDAKFRGKDRVLELITI